MPVKPTAPFRIRCVCGESIKVIGHANSTVETRRRFAMDHRECREALDAEIKQINLHQGVDSVTRTMQ